MRRALDTTSAPACASPSAIVFPIPELPPTTTATFREIQRLVTHNFLTIFKSEISHHRSYQLNIVPSSFRFTGKYARSYGNFAASFSS